MMFEVSQLHSSIIRIRPVALQLRPPNRQQGAAVHQTLSVSTQDTVSIFTVIMTDSGLLDQLKPLALLGGFNAAELWPTNNLVLLTWGLLAFLPRWEWTPKLSLISPLVSAVVYSGGVFSLLMSAGPDDEAGDFSSLEGVVTLFKDPNGVFVGWVHYVVFDALVGRMITLDSGARGASMLMHFVFVVPCLFFTLMLGPFGFLLYMIGREFLLPIKGGDAPKAKIL